MNEFSPQAAPPPPPAYAPQQAEQHWLKRPVLVGLSIPWLALCGAVVIGAAAYLFAPETKPNVNRLAFGGQDLQPAPANEPLSFGAISPADASAPAVPSSDLSLMQDQIAAMVGGVRTHSEVNRQAIEELAKKVNALAASNAQLTQQVSELQAQNALLSARPAVSPSSTADRVVKNKPAKVDRPSTTSPLAGMRISAVQNGMAWVYWQDKTWAVQVGDPLGPVTVTGIDAQARLVRTSAGTLQ
jgi:intracellular multiplication protein IcmG